MDSSSVCLRHWCLQQALLPELEGVGQAPRVPHLCGQGWGLGWPQSGACGTGGARRPELRRSAEAPAPERTHTDTCVLRLGMDPGLCWGLEPLPALGACWGGCGEPAQPCSDPVFQAWLSVPGRAGGTGLRVSCGVPWARGSFLGAPGCLAVLRVPPGDTRGQCTHVCTHT